ncbi:DUF6660 family protein [Zunongwangia sp. F363]|uniref:DUF6660 family protein n=1 Tax=Autumnicola tepida TaxID=3075595 RepID=A0ABU3C8R2_9FLAO|nr:DUF6660 family protein [Zunongwangia sp. F363]MDT0642658.1 DUF6660 family protein [Zunongwangia sp. F363]
MKIIAAILSFYFLGLNAVPCGDDISQFTNDLQETVSALNTGHSHGMKADFCSPFCQCHCCHVHVVNFQTSESPLIEQHISTLVIANAVNSGDEIPDTHFQPPRV